MQKKLIVFLSGRLLIFLLFLIPILEVGVRLWMPQQLITPDDIYVSDSSGLGIRIASNLDLVINTGEKDVRLVTDTDGYRIPVGGRTAAGINILAVGDSFLQALQVDYEDTMTASLEKGLAAKLGETVNVVNTGAGAYSPNHYAILTRRELKAKSYDMVLVFVYTGNDFINSSDEYFDPITPRSRKFRVPYNLTRVEIVDAILYPVNDVLEKNSHLYVLMKNQLSSFLAKIGLTARYFPDSLLVSSLSKEYWEVTADVLSQVKATADEDGIPVLYVLLPSSYQIVPEELTWAKEAFNIANEEIDIRQPTTSLFHELQLRDLAVVDMYPPLLDFYAKQNVPPYGRVDYHLSEAGHQVIAEYILNMVLQMLASSKR